MIARRVVSLTCGAWVGLVCLALPASAQTYPPPPPDLGPPQPAAPKPFAPAPPLLRPAVPSPPGAGTAPTRIAPAGLAPGGIAPAPPALLASPTGARPDNPIGSGQSLPLSDAASNITPDNTASVIAPRLPDPPLDDNAPPADFLAAARQALAAGRTGEGQEALERAESRALDRAVRPSLASQASRQPLVQQITRARDALAGGDIAGAIRAIDGALANPESREREP
jgi:hypothetical protein